MALGAAPLLEKGRHTVTDENTDTAIGNRTAHTELICPQSRKLVLHLRLLCSEVSSIPKSEYAMADT